ncbi:MAG: hypothetical protein WDZ76_07965 [Pseudohongiellaceae bacterium]
MTQKARKPVNNTQTAITNAEQAVWTPATVKRAKAIAADKKKSVDLLKRAGILNEDGILAKEYTN